MHSYINIHRHVNTRTHTHTHTHTHMHTYINAHTEYERKLAGDREIEGLQQMVVNLRNNSSNENSDLQRHVSEVQKERDQVRDERDRYIRALYEQTVCLRCFVSARYTFLCVVYATCSDVCLRSRENTIKCGTSETGTFVHYMSKVGFCVLYVRRM